MEAQDMAIEARIRELAGRHQSLDRAIQDASRPGADDLLLRQHKRQKLRLKEELEALRGRMN